MKLLTMMAVGGLVVLLLFRRADAKPTDPAADFFIDISELAGEPCGIRITTDKAYWQLPAEQMRRGYGLGLFCIARNTTNNCEARIYVEVEDMGTASLDAALDKAVADLASVLEPHQVKVEGEVTRDKIAEYTIGATKLRGAKVRYAVKVLNADPVTIDPTTALILECKRALITITVENYASSTVDHFSRFLKTISIGKPPPKGAPWRLKMVDATDGTYRYLETSLPPGAMPERSDQLEGGAVGFCRREDGKPAMRIRIAKSKMDRPMEEKQEAEFRHSDLGDMYQAVSGLEEIAIGDKKAWLCTARDPTASPPRRLALVYFRPHGLMWTWTMESADDDNQFEKDLAAFRAALKTLNYWVGKVL